MLSRPTRKNPIRSQLKISAFEYEIIYVQLRKILFSVCAISLKPWFHMQSSTTLRQEVTHGFPLWRFKGHLQSFAASGSSITKLFFSHPTQSILSITPCVIYNKHALHTQTNVFFMPPSHAANNILVIIILNGAKIRRQKYFLLFYHDNCVECTVCVGG